MSNKTGRYIARVCYDEDFKEEMDKFLRLIYLDKEMDKLAGPKKNKQRFSAVVRWLIKTYNTKRGPVVLDAIKSKSQAQATS